MKIYGKKIEGVNTELVVIPRTNSDGANADLVFVAKAVLDYKDFEKLCPAPIPPTKMLPGGITQQNVEDSNYKRLMADFGNKRINWMILKSISETPGLEWETVKADDPDSWGNYVDELTSAGLSGYEVNRIIQGVMTANGLDANKIEEAKKRFLASSQQEKK